MNDEELNKLRHILTCAIMTAKVREFLQSDTLDAIYADLEKWAKENGHWMEPKLSKDSAQ